MTRICLTEGCPTLTNTTRCPACTRQRDRQRGTTTERGLGAAYQRNRAIVLAGNPPCYVPGCTSPATTADHIVPRRDGGGHEVGNLRPSCPRHNAGRRD